MSTFKKILLMTSALTVTICDVNAADTPDTEVSGLLAKGAVMATVVNEGDKFGPFVPPLTPPVTPSFPASWDDLPVALSSNYFVTYDVAVGTNPQLGPGESYKSIQAYQSYYVSLCSQFKALEADFPTPAVVAQAQVLLLNALVQGAGGTPWPLGKAFVIFTNGDQSIQTGTAPSTRSQVYIGRYIQWKATQPQGVSRGVTQKGREAAHYHYHTHNHVVRVAPKDETLTEFSWFDWLCGC